MARISKDTLLFGARFSTGRASTTLVPLQTDRYPELPIQPYVPEGEVKEKPGGCGCRMAGTPATPGAALGVLLLGAVICLRRRN